jgi:NAD-dependent dihydropyrimidine dehydrogenase PreA subunit
MIANYGFEDGSGAYYIRIDTDKCINCSARGCVKTCPAGVFELKEDDWGNMVSVVKEQMRNKIKTVCAPCKPIDDRPELFPCQAYCDHQAIDHSW